LEQKRGEAAKPGVHGHSTVMVSSTFPQDGEPASIEPGPKPWIMGISPYVPGKAADDDGRRLAKLSSNENPLGTSDKVRSAVVAAAADLATYPDAGACALREAIARVYDLDPARVIYGTGSDELLRLAASAYAGPGDEVLYVRHGFSVFDIAARRAGATPVVAPDQDYGTDVDALLASVTDRTRVVYIANPNNPTGTLASRKEIWRLQAALPRDVLLVLDHAYTEYLEPGEDDLGLELAKKTANVLVTRTFSKIFGLAAERIGWGYASANVIGAMHRIRAPFNVTTAGLHAAQVALADGDWVDRSRRHNRQWRDWFAGEIGQLDADGIRVVPSFANFVLLIFRGALSAETAYRGLMEAGYATRWLAPQDIPDGLRITIGTEAQMRSVAEILHRMAGEFRSNIAGAAERNH